MTLTHGIYQDDQLAVVDETDIVYRPREGLVPLHGESREPAGSDALGHTMEFEVDPRILFRFSALTYNAHRIHYDHPYAQSEGYPDLVVQGPLQVLLMAELLRGTGVDLLGHQFAFRLVRPIVGSQRLTVATTAEGAEVFDGFGARTAVASVGAAQGATNQPRAAGAAQD